MLQYGKKRKMANSTSYLDQKRAEAAASNDALERSVTTAREAKPQAVYTEMKLVQMGTDRMRRKQARLSKRFVEPEKRNSNTIMAQLRRVCCHLQSVLCIFIVSVNWRS